jgi:hypothetical protein
VKKAQLARLRDFHSWSQVDTCQEMLPSAAPLRADVIQTATPSNLISINCVMERVRLRGALMV